MTRGRPAGPPVRVAACLLALLWPACAARSPRIDVLPSPAGPGYRALFRGEAEGPDGRSRFRLAAALLPPDRLRLEFLGPAGGPRVVFAADADAAVLILPAERAFDRAPAGPEGLGRLLGVPLRTHHLVALLTARPFCAEETALQQIMTRPAATFGRTHAWFEVDCPPNDVRYLALASERGGPLREATVREPLSGAIILRVEYGAHAEGGGPRWPRLLRLRLREETTVRLEALEGPVPGELPESSFTPVIPEGFVRKTLRLSLSAPGLAGPAADGER